LKKTKIKKEFYDNKIRIFKRIKRLKKKNSIIFDSLIVSNFVSGYIIYLYESSKLNKKKYLMLKSYRNDFSSYYIKNPFCTLNKKFLLEFVQIFKLINNNKYIKVNENRIKVYKIIEKSFKYKYFDIEEEYED